MPTRPLPQDPNLEQLGRQARSLQRQVHAGDPGALALVREFHPRLSGLAAGSQYATEFARTQAQLVIARRYGFPSWSRLRAHLEIVSRYSRSPHLHRIGDGSGGTGGLADEFLLLACLTYGDDDPDRWRRAGELLDAHPELATASIHTMAAVGAVDAARELLERDPAQARAEGGPHSWEPLMYAAYSRLEPRRPDQSTLEVARLLLDHGADPNTGYLWSGLPSPFTALTGAFGRGEGDQPAHRDCLKLARLLLSRGADPNDSQTLYNVSVSDDGGLEHLTLLLEFGLGRGSGGPWHARLSPAHPSPAQLLEDELLLAAERNQPERARLVIERGVDVDGHGSRHPIREGATAYEIAVRDGSTEVAELLLAAGAARSAGDGAPQLLGACLLGDRDSVARLLAADPALAGRAIEHRPHHIVTAAARDRLEGVRLMIELGFDVNARHRSMPMRETALHRAAWNGNLEMVRFLVEHGADPTLRDTSYDATPQGWAEHNGRQEVAGYLGSLG